MREVLGTFIGAIVFLDNILIKSYIALKSFQMGKPAARVLDSVAHPLPPVLTGSPGSMNVMIGKKPAWRGIPTAGVPALQTAKSISDGVLKGLKAATVAASGTPGYPVAKAAEEAGKITASISMGSMIAGIGAMADIHMCATPLPIPPHGPGVVIDGSTKVFINGMPAAKMGCTIVEALGPPNKITSGCFSVMIA